MGKKLPYTPNSKIKNHLRKMWLQSRERSQALKRDNYTCQSCKRKQSKAKGKEFSVEVHHINGHINWEDIILYVREHLLVDPNDLTTLCPQCHDLIHRLDE